MPRLCRRGWPSRGLAAALFLALTLCNVPLGGAAAQGLGSSGNEPIQIHADSGIEWQQNAHLYIARGNAVATRGENEVHADTLIAHYRETKAGDPGGSTEIYRVEAEGHVMLKRAAQTVVGDQAVYDVDKAIAVVTGKGLKLTTPADTVTARDSLEWYDLKQIAVARGDAVAIHNGRTIKADVLTAYMVKTKATGIAKGASPTASHGKPPVTQAAASGGAAAEDSKISRVDAQGHVVVTNAIDTGRGNYGVYNADTGIATLIGHVVIERGKDVIRGERGVMDLNHNVSRMMPGGAPGGAPGAAPQRVQGLFVREGHNGGHGGQEAKPAAAPGSPAATAAGKSR